jgi:hypothetical protein
MELLFCTKCEKDLPRNQFHERPGARGASYHCRGCRSMRDRSVEVWNRAFKRWGTVCVTCDNPRKLATERECADCLRRKGLKKCSACSEVKVLLMDFFEKHGRCKDCEGGPEALARRQHRKSMSPSERRRDASYRRLYGITLADYEAMMTAQEDRCAICGETPPGRTLHVDHDHETKKVRGLLCYGCNSGIGHFRDRPDLLRGAIDYLSATS